MAGACPVHVEAGAGYLALQANEYVKVLHVGAEGSEEDGWLYAQRMRAGGSRGVSSDLMGWILALAVRQLSDEEASNLSLERATATTEEATGREVETGAGAGAAAAAAAESAAGSLDSSMEAPQADGADAASPTATMVAASAAPVLKAPDGEAEKPQTEGAYHCCHNVVACLKTR